MIGCTPASRAASENSRAPKRLPLSVTATAGMRCLAQSFTRSFVRIAPWLNEKAEWTRRWTKSACGMATGFHADAVSAKPTESFFWMRDLPVGLRPAAILLCESGNGCGHPAVLQRQHAEIGRANV